MAAFDGSMPSGAVSPQGPASAPIGPGSPAPTSKIPEAQAGYMELAGAQKDGACSKVDVQGGVSLDLGCCNEFQPQDESAKAFCCGECEFGSEASTRGPDDDGANQGGQPPAAHPLVQLRANPRRMAG